MAETVEEWIAGDSEKPERVPKVRATFHVPEEVLDAARDTVYWTPGLTLTSLVDNALRAELAKLEQERGERFPARDDETDTAMVTGMVEVLLKQILVKLEAAEKDEAKRRELLKLILEGERMKTLAGVRDLLREKLK